MKNKESPKRKKSLKKFLYYFKKGFADPKYLSWERNYKWNAHQEWKKILNKEEYQRLLAEERYQEIALRAVKIESKTNLLFSFEKMALRDAVKVEHGAELFAVGLFHYIYGAAALRERFEEFSLVLSALPRKQTRVLTWPVLTVFGFIADPKQHIFLKPRVTRLAAEAYDFNFDYHSKPQWKTYLSLLNFGRQIKRDLSPFHPRDFIDAQSFIWVLGSDEYP
jgi:hypothetical protein